MIVARVEPSIEAHVARTDARGRFRMPQVGEGRWRINVCLAGFKTLEADLAIAASVASSKLRLVTEVDW